MALKRGKYGFSNEEKKESPVLQRGMWGDY
jgi:hypothetical protein